MLSHVLVRSSQINSISNINAHLFSLFCLEKIILGFPSILHFNAIAQLLNLVPYTHLTIMGFISLLIMTVSERGL